MVRQQRTTQPPKAAFLTTAARLANWLKERSLGQIGQLVEQEGEDHPERALEVLDEVPSWVSVGRLVPGVMVDLAQE